jgi:hypothetical protein
VLNNVSPLPRNVQIELLGNIHNVSQEFTPDSDYVQEIQVKLRRLAPRLFSPSAPSLPRTVSLTDVETANRIAAASSRGRSPSYIYNQVPEEPSRKRRKIQA